MLLPFVREIFADAQKSAPFARLLARLKDQQPPSGEGAGRISVSGLNPTATLLHLALLHGALRKPLTVLVANNRAADEMLPVLRALCELTGMADPASVVQLPAYDVLPFENLSPHPDIQEIRASALWKMSTGAASMVMVPIAAAAMRLRYAEHYSGLAVTVRCEESLDVEVLTAHLGTVGYAATDVVEMPGEYALRGGILDVFSPEAERPLRIELFGDEVESIRSFDPHSQRSHQQREEALLLPLTETAVTPEVLAAIHTRLSGRRLAGTAEMVEQAVAAGGVSVFPGWESYAAVAGAPQTVFGLQPEAMTFLHEPSAVSNDLESWWQKVTEAHERSNIGNLVRPADLFVEPQELLTRIHGLPGADIEQLGLASARGEDIGFQSQPTLRFHGSMPAMAEEIRKLATASNRTVCVLPSFGEVERMAEVFAEYGLSYSIGSRAARSGETFADEAAQYLGESDTAATVLLKGFVPQGFVLPESNLALFGTLDLFDESEAVALAPARPKSRRSAFLSDFRDLAVGDYVVHVEHGIGQYLGLKEIAQGEGEPATEFMLLEYAEGAKLYVPLTRLDLVQKYRSAEGTKPALSHLGTAAWAKTKARVKKAMKDMADELLKLYAARRMAEGFAFSADGQWQREFEDAFEYNETEDQLQATGDIKRDMESGQPMDRLLCGDVGYGKTEVGMRAAFKAVSDNKQVVVLAPTTVLVFQHFETFKQRFAAFPINIEMLSRFRSTLQQKEIIQRVEAGKVDIVIGTHRLLSKDLKFSDLGLVIVDEEQRFGVRHKERLKQLKKEVDVLTMSATPIPRTLHMSMVGLRDMSVIETPPKDRMAIQTVVASFDEKLIRTAIEHELERGGQVYFVHNRVESIYEIASKIQELVPRARVTVGHGQMSEGELEKVMLSFMRHQADVLVATTIIENGLDIPLCNTILINRADRHGLSELYQLRGRVGRENRRLRMYKRLAGVENKAQLADVRSELQDRYGTLPGPVSNLLDAAALKLLGERVGLLGIDRKRDVAQLRFSEHANVDPARLAR